MAVATPRAERVFNVAFAELKPPCRHAKIRVHLVIGTGKPRLVRPQYVPHPFRIATASLDFKIDDVHEIRFDVAIAAAALGPLSMLNAAAAANRLN